MIRVVGVMLLSLSVILIGKRRAYELLLCERFENSLLRLMIFAEQKIETQNMKLCDIYEAFSDEFLEKSGFLCLLRQQKNEDALSSCIKKFDKRLYVGERFGELLSEFSLALGKCRNRESCCELCKKYIAYLHNEKENEGAKRKEQAAMASKLSVIFGVFVALLVL